MNAELDGNLKRLGARSKTLSVRFLESLLNGVCGVRVCTTAAQLRELRHWVGLTREISNPSFEAGHIDEPLIIVLLRGFCVASNDQDTPAKYPNVAVTTVHVCMQRSVTLAHQSSPHS